MKDLSGKHILLVIGGGIAAYKCLELIRLIKKAGGTLDCVLTKASAEFVQPLTIGSLSGGRIFQTLFDLTDELEMGHIQLSRQADLILIAPATADLMAKMAHGLADDLASTLLLGANKRALIAPAMNIEMWHHPATQRNMKLLQKDGHLFIPPGEGEMACGEYGIGRMAEPEQIFATIIDEIKSDRLLSNNINSDNQQILRGKKIIVTAGPTHEPVDPVRIIANRSSGKQGYAIAQALVGQGAEVILISGPVFLKPPAGCTLVSVETAQEMLQAVENALPADIAIMVAAVADWRVAESQQQKIKKNPSSKPAPIILEENPDILATICQRKDKPHLVIGFAAETENIVENAQTKLKRKACDWIIANDVSQTSDAMGGDKNKVHIISKNGVEAWPLMSKAEVAKKLAQKISDFAGSFLP